MSVLHICNTFFEQELETPSSHLLSDWFQVHKMVLQLQFLPLLYAEPHDRILVTALPERPDPRLCLLENPPCLPLEHWGPSLAIAAWAKKNKLAYKIPDWETVRAINSKVFSFSEAPKLPGAALLATAAEVLSWIEHTPGPKVLKTAYGTAGAGHFHIGKSGLESFLKKQFDLGLPVIGEPWVERLLDFSTQWRIGEKIEFLGPTLFENAPNGTYRATLIGAPFGWELEEHLAIAKPLLEKIARMGFFGNLGIDAYVYRWQGKERLQPIVEINGRKTMSWAALQIQQRTFPGQVLHFSFAKGKEGPLPMHLGKINFSHQVSLVARRMSQNLP